MLNTAGGTGLSLSFSPYQPSFQPAVTGTGNYLKSKIKKSENICDSFTGLLEAAEIGYTRGH